MFLLSRLGVGGGRSGDDGEAAGFHPRGQGPSPPQPRTPPQLHPLQGEAQGENPFLSPRRRPGVIVKALFLQGLIS